MEAVEITGFSKFQLGTSLPLNSSDELTPELVTDDPVPEELIPEELVLLRSHATNAVEVNKISNNAAFLC